MILWDMEQGSGDWHQVRMGIPTASQFHRVLTPAKGELAAGRWSYAYELAVQRLLNEDKPAIDDLYWVERGNLLEKEAIRHFEFVEEVRTAKAGFITTDDKKYGCSPDRILVDELGGLELKCPSPAVHLRYFIDGPGHDYKCQVQGSMLVTGFPAWFFCSFHPSLPAKMIRYERDEKFIKKLSDALELFCWEVDGVVEKVKAAGYVPPPPPYHTPADKYAEILSQDPGRWAAGD